MSKGHEAPECIENDPRVDKPVNVKLSKVLDSRNSFLIIPIDVLFHAHSDVFKNLIHNVDAEFGVVSLEIIR